MTIALMFAALVCGAVVMYFVMDAPRRQSLERVSILDKKEQQLQEDNEDLQERRRVIRNAEDDLRAAKIAHDEAERKSAIAKAEHEAKIISYAALQQENRVLKTDLRNTLLATSRQEYEQVRVRKQQDEIEARVNDLGRRHLDDTQAWIGKSLTPNNSIASKERLAKAIASARGIGLPLTEEQEAELFARLRADFTRVVRSAEERENQADLRAKMREEALREREAEEAIQRAEHQRRVIEEALARALADVEGKHVGEIESLKAQLAEAEANSLRAKSQAQLTKQGHVYVISNLGSFGDGVFKIGMTRRLEPMDRVDELGDASVPFPFDVHMMISCVDAPKLEHALHQRFHRHRVNKTNPRKEFFRIALPDIVAAVRANHGEVTLTSEAAASQFRQSQTMTDADIEYIERVFEETEDESGESADEE